MTQENPTLKFTRLTNATVLELLNNLAVDAQWNVNNAKSPKSKRDAQDNLNLYASAVESIKQQTLLAQANLQQQATITDLNPAKSNQSEREQTCE